MAFRIFKLHISLERKLRMPTTTPSSSLRKTGTWEKQAREELAAPPIAPLGIWMRPNFDLGVKYSLGIPIYENERKCQYCKPETLKIFYGLEVPSHRRGASIAAFGVTIASSQQSIIISNAAQNSGFAIDIVEERKYNAHYSLSTNLSVRYSGL